MADLTPLFQAAGTQYNVDPVLLRAMQQVEDAPGNPNAVGPVPAIGDPNDRAVGVMQIRMSNAKAAGIDPTDPTQAIPWAANTMAQNLARYNGNVQQAVAAYHGGANQKNWGPLTQQYVSKVANVFGQLKQGATMAAQPQQQGGDLLMAMAQSIQSGQAPQQSGPQTTADPLMAMAQQIASGKTAPTPITPIDAPQGAQPISTAGRFAQGVQDTLNAGAQDIAHALPNGAVNAINSATQYVNGLPVIGPITRALGMTPATPQQLDQNIAQQEQQYQARRAAAGNTGIDWARMAGNVVGTAPLAMVAPSMAGAGMGARIGAGAALGAANGALTPVTNIAPGQSFGAQKAQQIGLGALTGGVAAPVAGAIGNTIAGVGGAAQQRLAQAGVNMTPGQILGGAWQRTEDKLTSIPVLGDFIKNAQQRAVQDFNTATYNQVLAPLGKTYSGPVGTEGVEAVHQTISNAYDNALSRMTFKATDPLFQSDIANLSGLAQGLPPAQQRTFMNILQAQVFGKLSPQGWMDGLTLKGAQSELSNIARGYSGDSSFDNRQLGTAIGEIKNAIDNSLSRYNAPDAVQDLTNANAAYANYVRLRGAAASQGAMNNGGVFTGAQLNNAVRAADKSVGKGATATGNALMQDFSTAGQQVLGSKYPDSGTPGRALLSMALPAFVGHEVLPPGVATAVGAGVGLGALPYTTYGQKLAQALLMSRPAGAQAVGQAVNRFAVPLAPALGNALLNGPNR